MASAFAAVVVPLSLPRSHHKFIVSEPIRSWDLAAMCFTTVGNVSRNVTSHSSTIGARKVPVVDSKENSRLETRARVIRVRQYLIETLTSKNKDRCVTEGDLSTASIDSSRQTSRSERRMTLLPIASVPIWSNYFEVLIGCIELVASIYKPTGSLPALP